MTDRGHHRPHEGTAVEPGDVAVRQALALEHAHAGHRVEAFVDEGSVGGKAGDGDLCAEEGGGDPPPRPDTTPGSGLRPRARAHVGRDEQFRSGQSSTAGPPRMAAGIGASVPPLEYLRPGRPRGAGCRPEPMFRVNLVFASGFLFPQTFLKQDYFRDVRTAFPGACFPRVPVTGSIDARAQALAAAIMGVPLSRSERADPHHRAQHGRTRRAVCPASEHLGRGRTRRIALDDRDTAPGQPHRGPHRGSRAGRPATAPPRVPGRASRRRRSRAAHGGARQSHHRIRPAVQPGASRHRRHSVLLLRGQPPGDVSASGGRGLYPGRRPDSGRAGERRAGERRVGFLEASGGGALADRSSRRGGPHLEPAALRVALPPSRGAAPGRRARA